MRLDYFIANSANQSRKEARRTIMAGRVTIDGTVCKKAATPVSGHETIQFDARDMILPGERYLMLNKPADLVSATTDDDNATVMELLPPELRRNLRIAGRLDRDTTGLLLLTTDGQWSHRVTSPNALCTKTYRVTVADPITDAMVQALSEGVTLKRESKPTAAAHLERLSAKEVRLTITEGRYHQVKRMLAAVGNHVVALHREQIGEVSLDPALAPGEFRALTEAEIGSFR
ncbi:pseudouridine synthase [Marinobacter caseinilyticus]|uniref:pseudouridine synthase n=1 Tax=Marinobacter caseinilyticus TaxID=2692195 RepID=UPI00140ABB31|nr:pseudouridine synthase [Marinobacter caseinilyticus]